MILNRIILIKNISDIARTYAGQRIEPNEEYQIQDSVEYPKFASSTNLVQDIFASPQVIIISNGDIDYSDPLAAYRWLLGSELEVVPTVIKNEYQLHPAGMDKAEFNPSSFVAEITLSNKVGLTYDYSSTLEPMAEDAVCSSNFVTRVKIEEVAEGTLTLDKELEEGTYTLSKHLHIDYPLPTPPQGHSFWFLWGLMFDAENYGKNDWLSLEVVAAEIDVDLKNYDSCWVRHLVKLTQVNTPDGSPGKLPFEMPLEYDMRVPITLRMDYYPTISTDTTIEIWYDYILALKDGE